MKSKQTEIFFKKNKIQIKKLYPNNKFKKNILINNVKPLSSAKINDLTFYDLRDILIKQKQPRHLSA